jgi:hypothetical protein
LRSGALGLAPIVLFVFNRPEHTRKTIESLQQNTLSHHSDLFVFADGARNPKEVADVEAVRSMVDRIEGFRKITVHKQLGNLGLADSVISGVSSVIGRYGKAIVVEDDLEFSPHFLDYINDALDRYLLDHRVFSIGGYSPPLQIPVGYAEDSYLSYRCCTWGWATWLDRWAKVDWDVREYDNFINDPQQVARFNRGGDDMSQLLKLQMEGKISSWGIRWDYAHFKNDAYCFRPTFSIVGNTGNDGTGTHCGATSKFDVPINRQSSFILPEIGQLQLHEEINRRFAFFYDGRKRSPADSLGSAMASPSFLKKFMGRMRRLAQK